LELKEELDSLERQEKELDWEIKRAENNLKMSKKFLNIHELRKKNLEDEIAKSIKNKEEMADIKEANEKLKVEIDKLIKSD
jgi:hypothetical protein